MPKLTRAEGAEGGFEPSSHCLPPRGTGVGSLHWHTLPPLTQPRALCCSGESRRGSPRNQRSGPACPSCWSVSSRDPRSGQATAGSRRTGHWCTAGVVGASPAWDCLLPISSGRRGWGGGQRLSWSLGRVWMPSDENINILSCHRHIHHTHAYRHHTFHMPPSHLHTYVSHTHTILSYSLVEFTCTPDEVTPCTPDEVTPL